MLWFQFSDRMNAPWKLGVRKRNDIPAIRDLYAGFKKTYTRRSPPVFHRRSRKHEEILVFAYRTKQRTVKTRVVRAEHWGHIFPQKIKRRGNTKNIFNWKLKKKARIFFHGKFHSLRLWPKVKMLTFFPVVSYWVSRQKEKGRNSGFRAEGRNFCFHLTARENAVTRFPSARNWHCVIACWVRLRANSKSWTVYAWWCGPPATSWGFESARTQQVFLLCEKIMRETFAATSFQTVVAFDGLVKKTRMKKHNLEWNIKNKTTVA